MSFISYLSSLTIVKDSKYEKKRKEKTRTLIKITNYKHNLNVTA